jgi:hypothetical protein
LTVKEEDGSPSISGVRIIKVSNGSLTDDGAGIVSIDTSGGSGDVVGPASAVSGHLAVFSGTTGKLIADGGVVPTGITNGAGTNVVPVSDGTNLVGPAGLAATLPLTTGSLAITGTPTSGNLTSIAASGTGATSNTKTGLNVATSGANATSSQTTFGIQVSNLSTGTSSKNIAASFNADNGATNWDAQFGTGGAGNSGVWVENIAGFRRIGLDRTGTLTYLEGDGLFMENSSSGSALVQWRADTAIGRSAAGLVEANNGTPGTFRDFKAREFIADATVTAGGTTGAQTINKSAGSVNFAATATSLVVTNSLVTASSVIICTVAANDTTFKSCQVVAGAGFFTIFANAAATGETRVNFWITN